MRLGPPLCRGKLVICISGLTGTGKSTIGRELAKRYGLKYVSGGELLRRMAVGRGYEADRQGWWESDEAMRFMEERLRDTRLDRDVDEKLVGLAREGDVVVDSWTMAWLLDEGVGLKVWLHASPSVRAERVAKRDGMGIERAARAIEEKDERTRAIYEHIYGFDLLDLSPYKLIIDTDNLSQEEVLLAICAVIEATKALRD